MPNHKGSTHFKRLKSYKMFPTQLQLGKITKNKKPSLCLEIKKYDSKLLNNLRSMEKSKESREEKIRSKRRSERKRHSRSRAPVGRDGKKETGLLAKLQQCTHGFLLLL